MASLSPTRMNLITLRKRIAVAEKGEDILTRKRQVLVAEFLKLLSEPRKRRKELNEILQRAYKTAMIASTYVGNFQLEEIAYSMKEASPISIEVKNIMGVKVPEIGRLVARHEAAPMLHSVAAEEVSSSFSQALQVLVDVAELEQGLRKVVIEIDKTKRQTNVLKYVVIPNMEKNKKYIEMRLDEIDRDMFIALKHTKKRLEAAQK